MCATSDLLYLIINLIQNVISDYKFNTKLPVDIASSNLMSMLMVIHVCNIKSVILDYKFHTKLLLKKFTRISES